MPEITLVDATFELLDAACRGDDALAATLGAEIAEGWREFPEALDMMRGDYEKSPAARRWCTLFFAADDPRRLVGWGGYKGAPKDGAVEIGYAIAPGERGKGYATAAAQAMIARAFASDGISAVTAHTLAEENASTSVLKKIGFDKVSDFIDPEDGPVWGWRRERSVDE